MGDWLLVAVGLLYLGAGIGYYNEGMKGYALAFAAYALANVGLIWAAIQMRNGN
jgi:hypothetical protein